MEKKALRCERKRNLNVIAFYFCISEHGKCSAYESRWRLIIVLSEQFLAYSFYYMINNRNPVV
jgi:hypothetical protein